MALDLSQIDALKDFCRLFYSQDRCGVNKFINLVKVNG